MGEYTPTTDEVRHAFGEAFTGDGSHVSQDQAAEQNRADFDRWLTAHDAEREHNEQGSDYQAVCGSWDCLAPECKPSGANGTR